MWQKRRSKENYNSNSNTLVYKQRPSSLCDTTSQVVYSNSSVFSSARDFKHRERYVTTSRRRKMKTSIIFKRKVASADINYVLRINYVLTSFREYGTAVRRPQRPTTLFKQVHAPRHHHPNSNNNSVLNQQHVGNPHPTSTAPINDNSQPPSRCPGPMPTPLSPCFSSPGSEVGEISESSNCSTSTTGKAYHNYLTVLL